MYTSMDKQFEEWMDLKEKLHYQNLQPHLVKESEIWWASLGKNIGFEINGKSTLHTRPVIILKKLSKNFYLVVPTTSQIRKGTWYVNFSPSSLVKTGCIHQIRTIDDRRLHSRMGQLSRVDFSKLKEDFFRLYQ